MDKKLKIGVCFCLALFCGLILTACRQRSFSGAEKKAAIGDVSYSSLSEAVEGAKTGDTIRVYDDISDNKNVVINKPLSIEGIVSSNQVKPKFYGSFTIDLSGEDDSASIENLEIIHGSARADGVNNDTSIGLNLIDGGLVFKSNRLRPSENIEADKSASGMVISRRKGSVSTMPIEIDGNYFGSYKTNKKDLSGAVLIKSGGDYQTLSLNNGDVYNSNSFSSSDEGNLYISIDYSLDPEGYEFFVTSSADEMFNALKNRQVDGANYTLIQSFEPTNIPSEPIEVNPATILTIEGTNPVSLGGVVFKVGGTLYAKSEVEGATFERTGDSASIITNKKQAK